ncbi:MAG: arginyl-tRNA synthetase [Parcubacteria group bacterium Licking1014_17]|nr:MAG: arginyl-tRNA synthetase [Parcubacteria group bacterium Licking1014_17]
MIREIISKIVASAAGKSGFKLPEEVKITPTPEKDFGDYSTNIAFILAKQTGRPSEEIAGELAETINSINPPEFEKVETAGGYVNFFLNNNFIQKEFEKTTADENFGIDRKFAGKTVMVEFTDANPFKIFHIGHLMSNSIGEALSRLYEVIGAKVLRVNWQGDIGVHVAKTIWAIGTGKIKMSGEDDPLAGKLTQLGQAYALGNISYEDDPAAKVEIDEINKKLYEQSDPELNKIYTTGRQWSLDYFETVYDRLGTKFIHYFFESEMGPKGLEMVWAHPDIFEEDKGAIIFRGENYGLHTRVFISAQGLPTYEAKELGLNQEKFNLYHPDLSLIVTGNEIVEYFRVLLKVMSLIMPDVAEKTRHIAHGTLRLPTGKMSSRTGTVISAEELIEDVKKAIISLPIKESKLTDEEKGTNAEAIAIGAIKYSILKQRSEQDIIFDFEKSLSVSGNSGPYLQYTFARLAGILEKAGENNGGGANYSVLVKDEELDLMKKILRFSDAVMACADDNSLNHLATFLYELCSLTNYFYEKVPVNKENDAKIRYVRLGLIKTVKNILGAGLNILGIKTLEKI